MSPDENSIHALTKKEPCAKDVRQILDPSGENCTSPDGSLLKDILNLPRSDDFEFIKVLIVDAKYTNCIPASQFISV